jgi:chromosome segregation ATPase
MYGLSWKLIGILAVVAAIVSTFVYITVLRLKLDNLTAENKHLMEKVSNCQNDNKSMVNKFEELNREIEKFKSAADNRLKEREAELARAKKEAQILRDRAGGIISKQPTPGANLCTAANDLINEEIVKK